MAQLLQLQDAHKRYGEQELLDGASVAFTDEFKVGLIGRNGCGKSTVCRILMDDESLDGGRLMRHPRLRVGYLRQHDPFAPDETVLDFLMRDSGQPEWRCGELAWRFAIDAVKLERPIGELSGGWQTRVKLAALLLHDPNFLILDEPTNFLDLRTQMFLQAFLQSYRSGCLIVSHDRTFLQATCTHTLELQRGRLTLFPGKVDEYLAHQQERREHDRRANATIRTKQRQLERFISKNRAGANTASQARSKSKQLARLQVKDIDGDEAVARIHVPEVQPRKGAALLCDRLAIGYPDHRVADQIHLEIQHTHRIVVVGDNGQGKTTFLRSITGSLELLDGHTRWGYGCDIGVYAQHVYHSLPAKQTVLQYLEDAAIAGIKSQTILDVAGSFLFRGDDVEKKIAVLSGGERARLCLAGLLLGRNSVLVMDEPINHLDVETVDALADALCEYQGTVIFTSHDRHFIQRVATGVVEVRGGQVVEYPGDYATYVYRVQQEINAGLREATPENGSAPRENRETRKDAARRQRQRLKEVATLERRIAQLEEQKRSAEADLLSTTDPSEAARLHEQVTQLAGELNPIEERWFALQEPEE